MNKKTKTIVIILAVVASLIYVGIDYQSNRTVEHHETAGTATENWNVKDVVAEIHNIAEREKEIEDALSEFSVDQELAFCELNDNIPYFEIAELTNNCFIQLSELDSLGRTGPAEACLGPELLPEEERGEIGKIKPSGWHTVKYNDIINGNFLFNRCHQLAFCLTGLNADERNLMTGTRFLNCEGMLSFETKVVKYIEETGNHVMYRVTPYFKQSELVAHGVIMEALSIEDSGKGIQFCVYCYNYQPGIEIDYKTGESWLTK